MAINNKDDYEKLAKILYPSIEASGNVYYGQTRKLTMDEILGKNELNFESHIETFKQGDQTYKSYFNWKIGPLKGAFRIEPIEDDLSINSFPDVEEIIRLKRDGSIESITDSRSLYGTIFAKYCINTNMVPVANLTGSGSFLSYELHPEVELDSLILTDYFDPTDATGFSIFDINGRKFYITEESNNKYILLQICTYTGLIKDKSLDRSLPLTITVLSAPSEIHLYDYNGEYLIKINDNKWVTYDGTPKTLYNVGDRVSFMRDLQVPIVGQAVGKFNISGSVKVHGNIASMLTKLYYNYNFYYANCFYEMFSNNNSIVDASELIMMNGAVENYSCYRMFADCTNLIKPPMLPSIQLNGEYCYAEMFNGCTSMRYTPELPAQALSTYCYEYMFNNCSSIIAAPIINVKLIATEGCCHGMFANCSNLLITQPILSPTTTSEYCYEAMFANCVSIEFAPILPAQDLRHHCYLNMFSGCTSLKYICCLANDSCQLSASELVGEWTSDITTSGKFNLLSNKASFLDEVSVIPTSWNIEILTDEQIYDINHLVIRFPNEFYNTNLFSAIQPYKDGLMSLSGSNSLYNGRGLLNDESVFNMETYNKLKSGTIQFDNICEDGSINQEIWGRKSFNSPIYFRNGIYGEKSICRTFKPELAAAVNDTDLLDNRSGSEIICSPKASSDNIATFNSYVYNPTSEIQLSYGSIDSDGIIPPNLCRYASEASMSTYIPSDDAGTDNILFYKKFTFNRNNGSTVNTVSKVINDVVGQSYRENTIRLATTYAEENSIGSTSSLLLRTRSDSMESYIGLDTDTVNISATNNVVIDAEEIKFVASNFTLDSNLLMHLTHDYESSKSQHNKVIFIGATDEYSRSAGLILDSNIGYGYNNDTLKWDILTQADFTISNTVKDENENTISNGYIKFSQSYDHSFISIGMTTENNCAIMLDNSTYVYSDFEVTNGETSTTYFKIDTDLSNNWLNPKIIANCSLYLNGNNDINIDNGDINMLSGSLYVDAGEIYGVVNSLCEYESNKIKIGAMAFIYFSTNPNNVSLQHGDIIVITDNNSNGYVDQLSGGQTNCSFSFYFARGTTTGLEYNYNAQINLEKGSRYVVMCDTDNYINSPMFAVVMRIQNEE